MRMRHKKHEQERLLACSPVLIRSEEKERLLADPQSFFPAPAPLHLEIGCGKGQFACKMASAHPECNFIAMERVSNVLCNAAENGMTRLNGHNPDNLRFMTANATDLCELLPPSSVERIYLNFSDPWPKAKHERRRLTAAPFLSLYRAIVVPGGLLQFKTDNEGLFDFSLSQFESMGLPLLFLARDLHRCLSDSPFVTGNQTTEYEDKFTAAGMPIHMAVVRLKDEVSHGE